MNIFEISDKSKISVKALKRLDKLGVLRHDANLTILDDIRGTLRIGNKLSVGQLVYLIDNPAGLLELGKYGSKAEPQIEALENPAAEAAPPEVSSLILDAFEKQPEAIASIVAWLKTIIPEKPVGHAYVASRLLLGVPAGVRAAETPRLQRVMMHCRDNPDFAGWWRRETSFSRNRTVYQKTMLDL
jgi:hypothetical protein